MDEHMNLRKVWVELLSLTIVRMSRSDMSWCLQHKPLTKQCKDLFEHDNWKLKVFHCNREANQVLDRLANMGFGRQLGVSFLQTPSRKKGFGFDLYK